ncbi:hypothetical protein IAQ67_28815 (plasmid) [Paenibacillus peoriae]|uniref:Uncharacterized protein n=1 Tax=Paenibacillus peoriae TaxID=59893 RepID=A0A7H0YH02_9BACL|nr:hypothetical protein [Paenibacillus peoriae]QNR70360.1 hypothetical protein IAQ67_28815 [Paenibacillus peoriae]
MPEIQDKASLEAKALEFYHKGEEIKKLQEERDGLKYDVGELMKLSNQDDYRFGISSLFDLKIAVRDRSSKKIDKEELAKDLGCAVSAINLEFLLAAVENGKLSLAKFRQYVFNEDSEQVSIRRVNAE